MDIRPLTEGYSVSPMIAPEDFAAIADAGFTTVICNRPDGEVPEPHQAAAMRAKAEDSGLTFVDNPMLPGGLSQDVVDTQRAAIDDASGPVLAYCASGNRSSILWALAMAGRQPTDALVAAGTQYGYQIANFRDQIDRLAQPE